MRKSVFALVAVMLLAFPAGASNDRFYPRQWGLAHIKAPEAWGISQGSGTVIAVIDSGVDMEHPDLNVGGKMIAGPDYRNNDSNPQDDNGHGTHVAGIAAAATSNGEGVAGVAPAARIMALKVLSASGSGSTDAIIRAIDYAAANRAHVINLSLGDIVPVELLHDPDYDEAIKRAVSRGSVVVASAGNDGYPFADPATADVALIVGATDKSGNRAPYSNSGPGVNIWAPGGNDNTSLEFFCSQDPAIWSTYLRGSGGCDDNYDQLSGTSMSAPHVAGVAALIRSANPRLTAQDVRNIIISTADTVSGGLRRVNALRAVQSAGSAQPGNTGGAAGGGTTPSGGRASRGGAQSPQAPAAPAPAHEQPSPPPAPPQTSLNPTITVESQSSEPKGGGLNWLVVSAMIMATVVGGILLARHFIPALKR